MVATFLQAIYVGLWKFKDQMFLYLLYCTLKTYLFILCTPYLGWVLEWRCRLGGGTFCPGFSFRRVPPLATCDILEFFKIFFWAWDVSYIKRNKVKKFGERSTIHVEMADDLRWSGQKVPPPSLDRVKCFKFYKTFCTMCKKEESNSSMLCIQKLDMVEGDPRGRWRIWKSGKGK